jgi:hypothetical protein
MKNSVEDNMAENTENPTIETPDVPDKPLPEEPLQDAASGTIETPTITKPVAPEAPKPAAPAPAPVAPAPVAPAPKPPIHKTSSEIESNEMTRKVSLIELIMILMLVGLVLVFIFGMQQMKIDKEKETIAQQKFESTIPVFDRIIQAMEDYRKQDEFGDYPITLDEIGSFPNPDFKFDYSYDDKIITAVSTKEFGKEGVEVKYSLNNSVYEVVDPSPKEKPTVKDDWLP